MSAYEPTATKRGVFSIRTPEEVTSPVSLLSAAPITPGGLGVVELALIGGLYAAGKSTADVPPDLFRAQIAAAVLLFRALTYGVQIPLGGITYLIWQRMRSWRTDPPHEEPASVAVPPQ